MKNAKATNRLIQEKSPYLLQHAHNPVDWYPWGEEAFAKARAENKPVLLSIGYSTCHWCHVMEQESFEDPQVAELMNKNFVSIKVDREERPEIDEIYMAAVMEMTGAGGWPMNVFLTPELKPFYGGTYFPPEPLYGRPSWTQVLEHLAQAWQKENEKLRELSSQIAGGLAQYKNEMPQAIPLEKEWLSEGYQTLAMGYDASHGGFGSAPKFPMPVYLNFLLRQKGLDMVLPTLKAMAEGGLCDQIGGGFHRYSTDSRWFLPHFEKMLYDNAQLAVNYAEAYQLTQDPQLLSVLQATLDYVLRDLTSPEGGFYSAEDADSLPEGKTEKAEGSFYVWTKEEILKVLGQETGTIFCSVYGVETHGNVSHDPQGEFHRKNILYQALLLKAAAAKFGKSEQEIADLLKAVKEKLLTQRSTRPRPHLDDKILTSWNGLMISALAKGFQATGEDRYCLAAEKAAQFLRDQLYDPHQKKLFHMWRQGEKKVTGMLQDYAFLVQGLTDLYEASFRPEWLLWAVELAQEQNTRFLDSQYGGFFMTSQDHDKNLMARNKEISDGVEPSGNSVAVLNNLKLAQLTGRQDFRQVAEKTLGYFSQRLKLAPSSLAQMLVALDYYFAKPQEIIIAGDPQSPETRAWFQVIHRRFLPHKILLLADGGPNQKELSKILPFLESFHPQGSQPTAYLCQNFACQKPITQREELLKRLED